MHVVNTIAVIAAIAATETALLAIAAAVAVSPVKRTVNAISDEQTALTARRSHHNDELLANQTSRCEMHRPNAKYSEDL